MLFKYNSFSHKVLVQIWLSIVVEIKIINLEELFLYYSS